MVVTKGKTNKAKPWTQAREAHHEKELADSKALIRKQPSAIGGSGLFATRAIGRGQLICPLDGTRKTHQEVEAAPRDHWWHEYALGSSAEGWSVIPDLDSVGWHLANHSCNPNAIIDSKRDNYLVARRDIAPDQENPFRQGVGGIEADALPLRRRALQRQHRPPLSRRGLRRLHGRQDDANGLCLSKQGPLDRKST